MAEKEEEKEDDDKILYHRILPMNCDICHKNISKKSMKTIYCRICMSVYCDIECAELINDECPFTEDLVCKYCLKDLVFIKSE